jgi:hypothetical protein
MEENLYAKGVTAESLRLLLAFLPQFWAEAEETHQILLDKSDEFLGKDTQFIGWCYLYEFPAEKHWAMIVASYMQDDDGLIDRQQILGWLQQFKDAPAKVEAIPQTAKVIDDYFAAIPDPGDVEKQEARPYMAQFFGMSFSLFNSLRCVYLHGCYLNELIERIRNGDDKALFDAVRIDPTVIGCSPVIARISKATLLKDRRFFAKLKAALGGKKAKREQANFQKMRLVLEVLHEAGATRLSDEQLQELFVDELKLYSGNVRGGGNAKALRKFADTYMKKAAST